MNLRMPYGKRQMRPVHFLRLKVFSSIREGLMDKHQQKFIDKLRLSDTLQEAGEHRDAYVAHLLRQSAADIATFEQPAPKAIMEKLCELAEALRRSDRAVVQFAETYIKHKIFPESIFPYEK